MYHDQICIKNPGLALCRRKQQYWSKLVQVAFAFDKARSKGSEITSMMLMQKESETLKAELDQLS